MRGIIKRRSRSRRNDLSRYLTADGREEWDFYRVAWALAISLLFHLGLFWIIPWEMEATPTTDRSIEREVEYVYEETPPEPEEQQFTETNPDVPTNKPDETTNFSNRDQQAQQKEKSELGSEDAPQVDGEEEESTKIVDGDLNESQPLPEATAQQESIEQQQQNPFVPVFSPPKPKAPDFLEQDQVVEDEGIASMLDPPDKGEEYVEDTLNSRDVPLTLDNNEPPIEANIEQPSPQPTQAVQPQQPRPRPRLTTRTVPGPIRRSSGRAPVMESLAVSANFSEFGGYLARVYEAIGAQFQNLTAHNEAVQTEVNTRVIVEFSLTRDGEVVDMIVAYSTAGRVATRLGQDAILLPTPYWEWTEEMVAILKEKEAIRATFIYQ